MKRVFGAFFIILLLILILFGCTSNQTNTASQEDIERQAEIERQEKELKDFASVNGILDAIKFSLDEIEPLLTIELQSKYQGKNVVFYTYLSDIYEQNGKYFIVVNEFWEDGIIALEAEKNIVDDLLKNNLQKENSWEYKSLIVLAKINTINRLHYGLVADGNYEEGYNIYIDNYNIIEIKGECINAKIIG